MCGGDGRRAEIFARIRERVRLCPRSGCWIWTGPDSGTGRGGGYPRFSLGDRTVAVHRVMATHAFGYIHPKQQVDHRCRNRRCVNPEHLEVVTHRENQRRRDAARSCEVAP